MHKGFFIILVWGLVGTGLAMGDTGSHNSQDPDKSNAEKPSDAAQAKADFETALETLRGNQTLSSENVDAQMKLKEAFDKLSEDQKRKAAEVIKDLGEEIRNYLITNPAFTSKAGDERKNADQQLDALEAMASSIPELAAWLKEVQEARKLLGERRELVEKLGKAEPKEKAELLRQLKEVEDRIAKSENISQEWKDKYSARFEKAREDRQKKELVDAQIERINSNGGKVSTQELSRLESTYNQIHMNLSDTDRERIQNSIDRLRGSATPTSNFANQPQTPSSNGQQANGETGKNSSRGGAGGGGGSSGGSGGAETCIACGKPTNTGSSHSQSGNNSPTGGLTKPNAGGSVSIAGAGSMGGFSGGSSGGGSNSINRAPAQSQPVTFQPPSATIPNGTGTANSGVNGTSSQSPNQGQALSTNGKPSVSNYFFGGVGSGGGSQDLPASKGKLATETGDLSVGKPSEGGNSRRSNGSLAGIAAGGTTTNSSSSNSNSPTPDNSSPTWESGKGPETAANSVKKSKVTPYQWGLAPSDSAPSESSVDTKMNAPEKNTINSKITNEEKNFNQVEKILAGNLPTPRFRPSELKANSGASELGNFTQQALGGGLLASNDPRAPASLGLMKKPNQNRKPTQLAASGSTSSSSLPTSRGFMTSVKSFGKSVFSKLASFFGLK